jgi:hypothetical protein
VTKSAAAEKSVTRFTIYQDKFVILYCVVLGLYLFLGFLVFLLPLFDPGRNYDLKLSFMIVPFLYSGLITFAVGGVAIRAAWAPKLYVRTSRLFLPVLILSSLVSFFRFGFSVSIAITVALVLILLPYILVLAYDRRYLKRDDVRASFESANR